MALRQVERPDGVVVQHLERRRTRGRRLGVSRGGGREHGSRQRDGQQEAASPFAHCGRDDTPAPASFHKHGYRADRATPALRLKNTAIPPITPAIVNTLHSTP